MTKTIPVRIDESLAIELKKIQENLKAKLGGEIDFSQPQASKIAAKILRDDSSTIDAEIFKSRRNRKRHLNIL